MKPKPSDWDFVCYYCGCRVHRGDCGGLPHLVTHRTMRALWGHEWAAVAWMALAEDSLSGLIAAEGGTAGLFATDETII